MEIVDKLCPACRKTFVGGGRPLKGLSGGDRYEHHNPPYRLEEAANRGCYVCNRVWIQLSSFQKTAVRSTNWWTNWFCLIEYFPGYVPPQGVYSVGPQTGYKSINFQFGPENQGWKMISFDLHEAADPIRTHGSHFFDFSTDERPSLHEYFNSVNLSPSVDTDQTWSTIFTWWNASMRRKENNLRYRLESSSIDVARFHEYGFFPTRILDLGCDRLDQNVYLLCTDKDKSRFGPYMTLSYRWSFNKRQSADPPEAIESPTWSQPWYLTHQSMDRMRSGIPLSLLPKVYQDTILVTRKLNIRYLWIDAMCIIQGDENNDDWKRESNVMGQIYDGAICNIAAGVQNVDCSLFGTRNPKDLMPLEIPAKWLRRYGRMDPHASGSRYLFEHDYLRYHLLQAPLNDRGWVFQERFFSKRILHFSPSQIFWQEHGFDASEVFPNGCPRLIDDYGVSIRPEPLLLGKHFLESSSWNQVIHSYSATLVTKPEDKMIALIGLVNYWQIRMPDDEYCAGLWKTTFPLCLLWKMADGQSREVEHSQNCQRLNDCACNFRPSYRSSYFRAPSWSWLSVNGKVETFEVDDLFKERDQRATVLAYNLPARTSDVPLGPPTIDAHIVVRGRLKSTKGVYWPMSSLHKSINDSDWSMIESRTSPFARPVVCSIDDMVSFLKMWNNALPSESRPIDVLRSSIYNLARYLVVFGTILGLSFPLGNWVWFGIALQLVGIVIRQSLWHFTNLSWHRVYFLQIYSWLGSTHKGLVVQQNEDGTYRRLGVFTSGDGVYFADVELKDVVLI